MGSYSTSIKQLEHQMGKLSVTLHEQNSGTLPSDTFQNGIGDGSYMDIIIRSGKFLLEPYLMVQIQVDHVSFDYEIMADDFCANENLAEYVKLENANDQKVDIEKFDSMNNDVYVSKDKLKRF